MVVKKKIVSKSRRGLNFQLPLYFAGVWKLLEKNGIVLLQVLTYTFQFSDIQSPNTKFLNSNKPNTAPELLIESILNN